MKTTYITGNEIIKLRDNMSVDELVKITNETKARCGYVDYRSLFETMGYTHAFNDTYIKTM